MGIYRVTASGGRLAIVIARDLSHAAGLLPWSEELHVQQIGTATPWFSSGQVLAVEVRG